MDVHGLDQILNGIDTETPPRLVLGFRSGKRVSLTQVAMNRDAQTSFQKIAASTVAECRNRTAEQWDPSRPVSKETFLVTSISTVADVPEVTRPSEGALAAALQHPERVASMEAKTLRKTPPFFYAIQFGSGNEAVAFIRKSNPRRGLAKPLVGFLSDQLVVCNEPVFTFDDCIDLVVTATHVLIFSQVAFTGIFRDENIRGELVERWVGSLKESELFTDASTTHIEALGKSSSRAAKLIESIAIKGHLDNLSPDEIRNGMEVCALDPSIHMNETGKIIAHPETAEELLKFLNEDLYQGVLTQEKYSADSKKPRQ